MDYLLQYLKSGNLYVNRGCTGARVAIEPFGGFKMSGTGPKAGSSSYVRSFFAHPKEEHLEKHLKSEQGEDYQFDPCGPTQLTIGNRIIKISKGISYLLQNYELIFKGVYEDDKTHLRALRKWLQTELIGFISKKHPNLFTPGQLNYSNISLIKEKGMVLAYDEKPEISILIQIIMALSVGSGVTVACRNQNSFLIWNEICRCFRERGISKQNFDVYFASEKVVSQVLEMGNLEFMLIDGDVNKIKEGLEWVAQFADKGDHVKHTFTPLDAYPLNDFESLCTQFTYERAFAINTMRHGAALELEV